MSMYAAQRTNFQPAMPRIAMEPGQQRQTKPRSMNRGKKVVGDSQDNRQALLKLAKFKASGIV